MFPAARTNDQYAHNVFLGSFSLEVERLQIRSESLTQFRVFERKFNGRPQEAKLIPGVVTLSLELITHYALALQKVAQAVRQLDFASASAFGLLQRLENAGRKDVPSNDRQVGGG